MKNAVPSNESRTSRVHIPAWASTLAEITAMMAVASGFFAAALRNDKPNNASTQEPAPAVKPADSLPEHFDIAPQNDRYPRLPLA